MSDSQSILAVLFLSMPVWLIVSSRLLSYYAEFKVTTGVRSERQLIALEISSDRINVNGRLRRLYHRLHRDVVHDILSASSAGLGTISASLARLEKFESFSKTQSMASTHLINALPEIRAFLLVFGFIGLLHPVISESLFVGGTALLHANSELRKA